MSNATSKPALAIPLPAAAWAALDEAQVRLCELALDGDVVALDRCARVILDTRAQW